MEQAPAHIRDELIEIQGNSEDVENVLKVLIILAKKVNVEVYRK